MLLERLHFRKYPLKPPQKAQDPQGIKLDAEFEQNYHLHFTCSISLVKAFYFFIFFSHFFFFFQYVSGAAPRSRHVWLCAKLPLSSPGPVTTQLSAPALIIILLPTNTAQLPLETLTPRLPQAGREREREKKPGQREISGEQQRQ